MYKLDFDGESKKWKVTHNEKVIGLYETINEAAEVIDRLRTKKEE